uniref:Uncharacterized protein n=1 Tax=Leersia perrieri TaxID=77586 RepID=A0A0D9V979_9ORYZ
MKNTVSQTQPHSPAKSECVFKIDNGALQPTMILKKDGIVGMGLDFSEEEALLLQIHRVRLHCNGQHRNVYTRFFQSGRLYQICPHYQISKQRSLIS